MRQRQAVVMALVLGLTLIVAACGTRQLQNTRVTAPNSGRTLGQSSSSQGNPGKEPIKIGMALGLSGYLATLDGGLLKGARMAVDALNAKGGILGRPVELVYIDMQSDPQQGVQAVQRLITHDKVTIVEVGFSSATTAAAAPIAARNQVPMMVASVLPAKDTEWVFTSIIPADMETGIRVAYLSSIGAKKVAVLYDATPYAELQLKAVKEQLKAAGIELVAEAKHATDATDLRSQLSKLLDANPDAILKFGAGPTNVLAAKGLAQLGSSISILMSIDDLAVYKQASAAYPHVMFVATPAQVYDELTGNERSEALVSFMKSWRAKEANSDANYPGRGWDGVMIAARAIQHAGTTDGPSIRQALEEMRTYEGISAAYKFSSNNHYGIQKNPYVLAAIRNGAVKIVYK